MSSAFLGTSNDPDEYEMPDEEISCNGMTLSEFETAFRFEHLPTGLQKISRPFCEMAYWAKDNLSDGYFKTHAIEHILLAKDAAVRAEVR